ncbi:MAG TPA: DUF1345 domain-containing protein [Mucilaginibacter sp.]|jgi:uncharacterized membrane protein|nr:DUF1345 domain-containing protein [Mucilaginibacter sp.]
MADILKPDKRLFFRLDAHYRLMIALAVSIIVLFFVWPRFTWPAVTLFTWISFALTVIALDWTVIITSHPREVRKIAKIQDSSRTFIFLFVIAASIISMVAIAFLLKSAKGHSGAVNERIFLSIGAVFISWWLVHTVFTMRYAHMYYDTDTDDGQPKEVGGLIFPDENEPDYLDFVYFSFVVGMTFQVSDVEISSRQIRRLAWLHGLLSFGFNTAIVALSINVISGLVAQ